MLVKKYLSILLMSVFLSPVIIQATHFLYIHHHHNESFEKTIFTQDFEKCLICSYEIVEFINSDDFIEITAPVFQSFFYCDLKADFKIVSSIKHFSLRAPPLNEFLFV